MRSILYGLLFMLVPSIAYADNTIEIVRAYYFAGIWVLANISYTGMRAQDNPSLWRIAAFIFGFPGTFITFLAVVKGSERAYGIDIPKKRFL